MSGDAHPKRPLSLHHLTALEVSPFELVAIAAAIGCPSICIFTHCPAAGAVFPVLGRGGRAEMALRLDDAGISIANIEFFWVVPDTPLELYRAPMELGASLGAKRIVVHVHDVERERAIDNFGRLCGLARQHGLGVGLEFMLFSAGCDTLAGAVEFVSGAGAPNAGVAIDALHLMRTGGSPAEVARIESHLISYAQLCDGPRTMAPDKLMWEAVEQRLIPGAGEFPLRDLLSALPASVPVDVEVPLKSLRDSGVPACERARLAVEGARRVVDGV